MAVGPPGHAASPLLPADKQQGSVEWQSGGPGWLERRWQAGGCMEPAMLTQAQGTEGLKWGGPRPEASLGALTYHPTTPHPCTEQTPFHVGTATPDPPSPTQNVQFTDPNLRLPGCISYFSAVPKRTQPEQLSRRKGLFKGSRFRGLSPQSWLRSSGL